MIELGVNIDHVATLRQARRGNEPDPVWAAVEAELGGAHGITAHLREDRRHMQERDIRLLRETVRVKFNLEMACAPEVLAIALDVVPDQATLVPEKRQEITTEGGLDVVGDLSRVRDALEALRAKGVATSLFIDPDTRQIEAAKELGADAVELHTGAYANASGERRAVELQRLAQGAELINRLGLRLHAGHGLNYTNVRAVATLPQMAELNIGHSIISRALFIGVREAVAQMKRAIEL
ncbi:MAG: pyridoxine 5'-phosphate synthase [Planctomycetia bacterium]|nr:pyridoxine 5'-phosphate synthase [Planctomycetia bacterium]